MSDTFDFARLVLLLAGVGLVVIVVSFSVLLQGSLVPTVAGWLKVPMRLKTD